MSVSRIYALIDNVIGPKAPNCTLVKTGDGRVTDR